ncbi:hypothetical protein C6Q04_29880 [Burkholderia multivorans]|nr:hypothetical protein C6Q04_29880 [Burkholderia multivorans]PRG50783.1 hypothetical protein C6T63_17785 [Burkholderia multivorans]
MCALSNRLRLSSLACSLAALCACGTQPPASPTTVTVPCRQAPVPAVLLTVPAPMPPLAPGYHRPTSLTGSSTTPTAPARSKTN